MDTDRAGDGAAAASGDLRVTREVVLPGHALHWRFSRAGGPGGQGVNTTDSRVELVVDLATTPGLPDTARRRLLERLRSRLREGTLTVVASEHRSQLRNREAARRRLACVLRDALAPDPPVRRPRTPSRRAKERRREAKARTSDRKQLRRRPDAD